MVFGAVKSLENVGSLLGQLTIRTAKEAIENTAQQIGKKAAAVLLLALSGALLHLSGALPTALPWLRPMLTAAKAVGADDRPFCGMPRADCLFSCIYRLNYLWF